MTLHHVAKERHFFSLREHGERPSLAGEASGFTGVTISVYVEHVVVKAMMRASRACAGVFEGCRRLLSRPSLGGCVCHIRLKASELT